MNARPFNLTDRQVEILELFAAGKSSAEVCQTLFITIDTLKTHLYRIGKRMGCGERAHMVAKAYQVGVLRIPVEELLRQADEIERQRREQRLAKMRGDLLRQARSGRAA